jgi:two-component system, NtrC family, nitrogen regulation response regulator NtrX
MHCLKTNTAFFEHSAGFRLFEERKFKLALEHFETEVQNAEDRRSSEYARFYAAKCSYVLGQYPRSKRYLLLTNKWAGKSEDRPLRMACIFTLATLEVAMGNHEKGLGVFQKFRELYDDGLDPYDRCLLHLNLALTHIRLKHFDQVEDLLKRASQLAEDLNDDHLMTFVHYYTGLLANRQGNVRLAVRHLESALEVAESGADTFDQCRCHWQLGNHYLRRERYDKALRSIKKAIRIAKKSDYKVETAKCLNDYAWAFFKKGKLAEAKSYAEEAILMGREAGLSTTNYLDTLEQINAHINDFYEEERLIAELERESTKEMQLVGYSDPMVQLLESIRTFAPGSDPVLICGETGTGKELVARAVHESSNRVDMPFIKRNCAAIPENLIESELFGHVKGAFTGAMTDRKGIFEDADTGTLFLDEIGEMPVSLQSKLLRVLEYGEFYRVGSTELIKVDVRLITATNRRLDQEVSQHRFREDLFFRLNTIQLDIPALHERKDDIALLVNHFLFVLNEEFDKYYKVLSEEALHALESYAFPGNVRELKNIVRAAYLTSHGRHISGADVRRFFQNAFRSESNETRSEAPVEPVAAVAEKNTAKKTLLPPADDDPRVVPFEGAELVEQVSLKEHVLAAEKRHLLAVLKQCDSVNKACAVLQISRPTFYQKLKVHGVSLSNKRLL